MMRQEEDMAKCCDESTIKLVINPKRGGVLFMNGMENIRKEGG